MDIISNKDNELLNSMADFIDGPMKDNGLKLLKEDIERILNIVNTLNNMIYSQDEIQKSNLETIDKLESEKYLLEIENKKLKEPREIELKKLAVELTKVYGDQLKTDNKYLSEIGIKSSYKEFLKILTEDK